MAKMELSSGKVETDITGAVDFGFSSRNAKKLAGMMANFLYSDKEYAVISELSANAYDAHRMIGKPELPIKVNMPTHIEQELVIRDYGPGMSETDVYKYLTQFGESSKQDDNDQVGFWGIGSKSPAAVAQNWSIISHYAGKKMHFEVFINEEGVPSLKKIFEGESDSSGLEVRVPVESNRFSVWETAAKKAFKRYDVKPTFNRNISVPQVEYIYRENTFGIRTNSTYDSGVYIVTTGREYQLDAAKLGPVLTDELTKSLLNYRIDLFFDIGEIDLSISREQLQYNAKTIKAIVDRLSDVKISLVSKFKNQIDTAKDGIEYRKILRELWAFNVKTFVEHSIIGNQYGVVNLPNDFNYYSVVWERGKVPVSVVYRGSSKNLGSTRTFKCFGTYAIAFSETYQYATRNYEHSISFKIEHVDKICIVLRDGVHDAAARIKYHGDYSTFYVITDKNIFGDKIKCMKASDFAKIPKEARVTDKTDVSADCYLLYKNSFNRMTKTDVEKTDVEKTVSIKISDARTIHAVGNNECLNPIVTFLKNYGYSIVGHKKDNRMFQTPKEALDKLIVTLKASPEIQKDIENIKIQTVFKGLSDYSILGVLVKYKISNKFVDDLFASIAPIIDGINKSKLEFGSYRYNNISKEPKTLSALKKCLSLIDQTYEPIGKVDFEGMSKLALNRYPMLQYIELATYSGQKDAIKNCVEYVNLIEQGV